MKQIQSLLSLFEKHGVSKEILDLCIRYVDICEHFDKLDEIPDSLNYVRLVMWANMTDEQRLKVVEYLEKERDSNA